MATDKNLLSYLLRKPGDDAPDWVRLGSGLNASVAESPSQPAAPQNTDFSGIGQPQQADDNRTGSGEDDQGEPPGDPGATRSSDIDIGGTIGSGLGLATGVPGASVIGGAIGTAIDQSNADDDLERQGTPGGTSFADGLLSAMSFGLLGESIAKQKGRVTASYDITDASNPPDRGQNDGPSTPGPTENIDVLDMQNPPSDGGTHNDSGGFGDPNGGFGGDHGFGDVENGSDVFAEGTPSVRADQLGGPDPAGPDDGYAGLDVGEAVIPTKSVEKYGADAMQAIISQKPTREQLRKALGLRHLEF
jgi:hypothetical protein